MKTWTTIIVLALFSGLLAGALTHAIMTNCSEVCEAPHGID